MPQAAATPEGGPPPAPGPCANCGAEVVERFCTRCGQDRGLTPHVPLRELVGEALGEALAVDGRMARTILPFLLRPGFLTAEFLAGRRVRYSSPLRLYLLTTVAFFLLASIGPFQVVRGPTAKGKGLSVGWTVEDPAAATGPSGPAGLPASAGPAGPPRAHPSGEPVGAVVVEADSEAELASMRKGGFVSRLLADRIDTLSHLSPEESNQRLGQALVAQAPRVLFFLVPIMAALLALLFRRSGRFFAEHFVFALHAHAFGFAALLPSQAVHSPGLGLAGMAAAALHLLLALRHVYRRGWLATGWRFAVLAVAYLLALALGVAAATLLALAFM